MKYPHVFIWKPGTGATRDACEGHARRYPRCERKTTEQFTQWCATQRGTLTVSLNTQAYKRFPFGWHLHAALLAAAATWLAATLSLSCLILSVADVTLGLAVASTLAITGLLELASSASAAFNRETKPNARGGQYAQGLGL